MSIIADILHELKTYPLVPSNYHRKLNCGSCHTLGLIPRRGCSPEFSSLSFERGRLYKLLVQLGDVLGISDYTSISVQHNYSLVRRKEKQGGKAHIVLIGSYSDKGIQITGQEGIVETQYTAIEMDTKSQSLLPSAVNSGDRYLLLYHKLSGVPYEAPTFHEVGGSVQVRCGEGAPLPRSRMSFVREEKEVHITFP